MTTPSRGVSTMSPAKASDVVDQRSRILDAALKLMSDGGVHAMSMRSLAAECGLNVATLYHYFPSKSDILTGVIEQRDYRSVLSTSVPPIDRTTPLEQRFEALLVWMFTQLTDHNDLWRLLLGESLRGDSDALSAAAGMNATFETALRRWLDEGFDDLQGDRALTARVLRSVIYGFVVESLALTPDERLSSLTTRAAEAARIFGHCA